MNNDLFVNLNEKNKPEKKIEDDNNKKEFNNYVKKKESNQEKIIVKEEKIEDIKEVKKNSNFFKPFPIKFGLDFKLNKKYQSVQKYDNVKVVSGTILPESNLIISSNIEGQLNTYYYSGEIEKHFCFFQEIKNINPVDKQTIIYSSEYSINVFDTFLGKNIWSFYAHDTSIDSLFFDEQNKNIISSTKNGIIHDWDLKHQSFIPIISHFLFDDNNIISTDYNSDTKFFYTLCEKSNINILNIFQDEEIYTSKIEFNSNESY